MEGSASYAAYNQQSRLPLQDVSILLSQDPLHWEFVISRLMKLIGLTTVALRTPADDELNYGVAHISATAQDWFAKFIVLAELADIVVFATMMTDNMAREVGYMFSSEKNRQKFVFRSSDEKFHLASEQEHAFPTLQLPHLAIYIGAKKMGSSATIGSPK